MNSSKNTHDSVRQNGLVKKPQKHDANLQKNSTLYFQVGLIVCLLAAFGLLEMRFQTTIPNYTDNVLPSEDISEIAIENFRVYEEPKPEVKPEVLQKKVLLTDKVKIVDDDHILKKAMNVETSEQNVSSDPPIDPGAVTVLDKPEDAPVPFIWIEQVPIYPGCEKKKTNLDRKKCMSEKISKLVQRKFRTGLAGELGLSGKQRINTQFTIDKFGKVTDIQVGSPYPKLQKEALRVINVIPNMQPGKQRDKPVGVRYTLPIIFIAE
ncbi:energy transducer TonB [Hyunsoonleella rubra]|uniref:Energy transducer TonB n=1 Tax=Hyunsoonleella rubra TaxID=1737062 RepID=A0ABW5TDL8_9FLAO